MATDRNLVESPYNTELIWVGTFFRFVTNLEHEATANLALVMNAMGHSDVRTAMRYQHPALDSLREVIEQRNLLHNSRHTELRVQ